MGKKVYDCSNACGAHSKAILLTCKSKFCPRCGAKATDQWMATQNAILPDCDYCHSVFTLPTEICQLFRPNDNRWLLNHLSKCSAQVFLKLAKKKGLTIGLFTAMHTFGRRLNWHVHMHISVTAGGLNADGEWVEIEFEIYEMRKLWKEEIAKQLRKYLSQLEIPQSVQALFESAEQLEQYLEVQCDESVYWHLFIAKKTKGCKRTAGYLGRYVRRPPVAASRLRHYNADGHIIFNYRDHKTGKRMSEVLTPYEMVCRLVCHIQEKHFRGIRYYEFLSNRVRGEMLPKVYAALGDTPGTPFKVTHASMAKDYTRVDPYSCVLCGAPLKFVAFYRGPTVKELLNHAENLALDRHSFH